MRGWRTRRGGDRGAAEDGINITLAYFVLTKLYLYGIFSSGGGRNGKNYIRDEDQ